MNFTTNELLVGEIPMVAAIANKCWDYPLEDEDFRYFLEDQSHWCVVAHKQGMHMPIGYCAFALKDDEMELHDLAVRERYRRQGAGHTLLVEAIKVATDTGMLRITSVVRESSLDALIWLRKYGFACTHIHHNHFEYYGDLEDGYLMSIEIDAACKIAGR